MITKIYNFILYSLCFFSIFTSLYFIYEDFFYVPQVKNISRDVSDHKIKIKTAKKDSPQTLSVYNNFTKSIDNIKYGNAKLVKSEENVLNKETLVNPNTDNNVTKGQVNIIYLPQKKLYKKHSNNNSFAISLMMLKKPEDTKKIWKDLQKQYQILQKFSYSLKKNFYNDQIFYYLTVGKFKNFNDAYNLCRQISYQECIVIKN